MGLIYTYAMFENRECFQNENFEMWIYNGIFFVKVLTDHFCLNMAEECVRLRMSLTGQNSYPMLSDSRCVKDFCREAREYLADKKNTRYLNAGAIVVNSRSQRIIGNFFIQINRPNIPSKIFTNEQEALKWLEAYKLKNTKHL